MPALPITASLRDACKSGSLVGVRLTTAADSSEGSKVTRSRRDACGHRQTSGRWAAVPSTCAGRITGGSMRPRQVP